MADSIERHAWIGFDGSYHCYGCGITLHAEPPEFGCDSIGVRARRVAESPMRYGRRHISALLLEAADRLDAQQENADQCIALVAELADVYTVDTDQVSLIALVQRAKVIKAASVAHVTTAKSQKVVA